MLGSVVCSMLQTVVFLHYVVPNRIFSRRLGSSVGGKTRQLGSGGEGSGIAIVSRQFYQGEFVCMDKRLLDREGGV